jgi:hypothetical protein
VYIIRGTMIDDHENSGSWLVMSFILLMLYAMHAVARASKQTHANLPQHI